MAAGVERRREAELWIYTYVYGGGEKIMSEIINIGGLSAAPGQRIHGFVSIGNGEFSLPATIVRGEKPGKTALITAGIHAGEYVGLQC